jgi:hypothetical protein
MRTYNFYLLLKLVNYGQTHAHIVGTVLATCQSQCQIKAKQNSHLSLSL